MNTVIKKQNKGKEGEKMACDYLEQQGVHIIERNYKQPSGEIDIIGKHHNVLLFIEVKYRSSTYFGVPSEYVTSRKKQKIINTAKHYLYTKPIASRQTCRFDVISIMRTDHHNTIEILWDQDAFREGE